ncbi:DNA oxidative demethylase AlkB [Thalassobaculum sp.]|uniref:DNA oxidative demethylase AlkB n=1 Tax=Thalassobaculum sp. TaxID=2022740 RepID=UPI0032EE50F4
MTGDLFDASAIDGAVRVALSEDAVLLRGRALPVAEALLSAIRTVADAAPFRRMVTPGGFQMSVAMTNCGSAGWMTDRKGYRYTADDPQTGAPWPAMPAVFLNLADAAAAEAGFPGFVPDACLINRYEPGARLSLHQDKDERDYAHPIVSVSLGLPATFQFGGPNRADPVAKVPLTHGDVVVWGGAARLHHHGVLTLRNGEHPATGRTRFNLTLRRAM